ncbi:MAG: tRNA lysidine(34) synthetase TilS, partial [Planctomycetota bacterium]
MRTQPWTDRFRRDLGTLCPLERVRRALVGVSGGPDSVALLRLLADLRGEGDPRPFPELIAAHVHHGIRGRDADLDAEFVKALAARLGVECLVARADAPAERRALGLSPEAAARSVRFRQFRAWAAEKDAGVLFLAQHAEDQAETVLLRAVRGSGVRGLAGMAPVRPLERPGGTTLVVRPLLSWSRADILRYLEAAGETYRTDLSNDDLSVPRNRLRREVLPVLEADVQPGARRSLARLAEIAGAVARDLESLGRRALSEARTGRPGGGGLLSVEALRAWPPSVVREALRIAVEEA